MRLGVRLCVWLSALGAFGSGSLAAQGRILPDVPSFDSPLASPRIAGFAGRVIDATRGESNFGAEQEGDVAIGENISLVALRRGPRPISLGFGVEVYGRFSLDDPKTALISSDWLVGFDVHADLKCWELDAQIFHESSHLGDEYIATFNARRIDWTREVLAGWAGYRVGGFRIMGGLSRALIDKLRLSPWSASAGVDYRARGFTLIGQRFIPIAGLFTVGESATDWRLSTSAKLGVAIAGTTGRKELRLSLIGHDGLSTQRQFFRKESRYVGLEIEFQL